MKTSSKFLNAAKLRTLRDYHFSETIVSTNGCFDGVHYGHIKYLQESKRLGDILIVGINTDDSVSFLKGPGHPLNSEMVRMEMVAALECVDYVFLFQDSEPTEWLDIIKPDFHTKGSDYKLSEIKELETVERNGGQIKLIDFLIPNYTVTKVKFFT